MKCKACGMELFEMPEHIKKGKGWHCINLDCKLNCIAQYDINEIETEDNKI